MSLPHSTCPPYPTKKNPGETDPSRPGIGVAKTKPPTICDRYNINIFSNTKVEVSIYSVY
jgi:hypothetical protein